MEAANLKGQVAAGTETTTLVLVDPVASVLNTALYFQGVFANLDHSTLNVRPPVYDLGSDVDVQTLPIVEVYEAPRAEWLERM